MNNSYIDNSTDFSTKFEADDFVKYIKKSLKNSFENEYVITEMDYDDLYEEYLPHADVSKKWSIQFYLYDENERARYLRESQYIAPKYEVQVSFTNSMKHTGENKVDFYDCSNMRTNFCCNAISTIKYFITKLEKDLTERYSTREAILMFIHGAVINYNDFSGEDLLQVINDKSVSKMRNVLEDPMWIRELTQYLDYDEFIPKSKKTHKLAMKCNKIN